MVEVVIDQINTCGLAIYKRIRIDPNPDNTEQLFWSNSCHLTPLGILI